MRLFAILLLCGLACRPVMAQRVLDPSAIPGVPPAGRAAYAQWLLLNEPRAFAVGPRGGTGWSGHAASLDAARAAALAACGHGQTTCTLYAENEDVVWPGREDHPPPPPGPLLDEMSFAVVPDARFLWWGPARARGAVVWAHGKAAGRDSRGQQPPALVRRFNNLGFDVLRFDRVPTSDTVLRSRGWLRDALTALHQRGWTRLVVAGQSRGGWNALQMLDTPDLVDAVVAMSPAAHGQGASLNLGAQVDDLREILAAMPPNHVRVVFAQFTDDPFDANPDRRAELMRAAADRTGGLLLIDRPVGLVGHGAGNTPLFDQEFGNCLVRFVLRQAELAPCGTEPSPRN